VENTRSDHRLQDNSLQTRTLRWRAGDKPRQGYKEFSRIALLTKPLFGGKISSHPTQDFILLFFYLKSERYWECGFRFSSYFPVLS
jgi:hypothetical protein